MKYVTFLFMTLGMFSSAFAGDASWTVCQSPTFLINAFERRAGFDRRATDMVLLYGGHVAKGIQKEDSKAVSLSSNTMKFKGELYLNHRTLQMEMDGTLTIQGEDYEIAEVLLCKDKTQTLPPGASSGH